MLDCSYFVVILKTEEWQMNFNFINQDILEIDISTCIL